MALELPGSPSIYSTGYIGTGSASWSHAHTGGADMVVVAIALTDNHTNPTIALTYDGVTIPIAEALNIQAYPGYKVVAGALADPGSKTANLVIDPSGSNVKSAVAYVLRATGLHANVTGAAAKSADDAWSASFAIAPTFEAEGSKGLVLFAGDGSKISNISMSGGVTKQDYRETPTGDMGVAFGIDSTPSGAESYTGTATGSADYVGAFAIELLAAAVQRRRRVARVFS